MILITRRESNRNRMRNLIIRLIISKNVEIGKIRNRVSVFVRRFSIEKEKIYGECIANYIRALKRGKGFERREEKFLDI